MLVLRLLQPAGKLFEYILHQFLLCLSYILPYLRIGVIFVYNDGIDAFNAYL